MKTNFSSVMTDFELCAIYEYTIIICIVNIEYYVAANTENKE